MTPGAFWFGGYLPLVIILLVPLLLVIAVLRDHRRRADPAPRCPKCGYNLTGNVSGVCPVCGTGVE